MIRGGDFDILTTWGEHDRTIRVTGHVADYYPAQGPTWNDPGSPADGGEVEDVLIFLQHTRKDGTIVERRVLDKKGKLEEELQDTIWKHHAP